MLPYSWLWLSIYSTCLGLWPRKLPQRMTGCHAIAYRQIHRALHRKHRRWVPALSELIPVLVRHHRGLDALGVKKTAQYALLSAMDQVNVTPGLLPCMRFDVYTESLSVLFLESYSGHSSLLAAEGLEPALREAGTSESPRPIYLDGLPQIHLLRKKEFSAPSQLRDFGKVDTLGSWQLSIATVGYR